MKYISIIALLATTSAFQTAPRSTHRSSSALSMGGFLDGGGARVTIRDDEDDAMWIDDGKGGRASGSGKPKKPKPKKPEAKKGGGFKFPWDK